MLIIVIYCTGGNLARSRQLRRRGGRLRRGVRSDCYGATVLRATSYYRYYYQVRFIALYARGHTLSMMSSVNTFSDKTVRHVWQFKWFDFFGNESLRKKKQIGL